MPVYKDENTGKFYVKLYYVDYTGTRRQKMKRGFKLQRDAKEWERHFLEVQQGSPDMTFQALYELYAADLAAHAKESTCRVKAFADPQSYTSILEGLQAGRVNAGDVRAWARRDQKDRSKRAHPVHGKQLPFHGI